MVSELDLMKRSEKEDCEGLTPEEISEICESVDSYEKRKREYFDFYDDIKTSHHDDW